MNARTAVASPANRAAGAEPVIRLDNVSHFFGSDEDVVEVIDHLDLTVQQGEFVCIVGPSGCGKSTLLNVVSGLLSPSEGRVSVAGRPADDKTTNIGYMLQNDLLLPWRTIEDNIILGLEIKGRPRAEARELARAFLRRYNLDEFAKSWPAALSGGMRQRIALIRTLVTDPDVILLDEPFSALDYQTRLRLEEEVVQVIREQRRTALLITHDLGEAISLSDRVIVLTRRPTAVRAVYETGLVDTYGSPLRARSAPEFGELFKQIWNDLDETMEPAA